MVKMDQESPKKAINDDGEAKKGFGVQSIEVGMHLLKVLMEFGRPVMLKELAEAAGMSAQKAHRYLVSLQRSGMVEQDAAGRRYGLGEFALNVGLAALSQLNVVRIAGDAVAELRNRTDQSCLLAVWGSHGPTIVRMSEGSRPLVTTARVGVVLSMVNSATGRAFAAFLPRETADEFVAAELPPEDNESFSALLADVRIRSISRTEGEEQATINALSAPLFDHFGNIVGALTLLGPEKHFNVDWEGPLARELQAVAKSVSNRLGYNETG
ncbi:MAG: IclR family transcriptional regulator [Rhodospirillaceae bacterium]|nr:IclR family transcriptional regulator [Rhodospirillaceae bacterium]